MNKRNRIIIIGNGFDLAHGLKTSYSNFIDWLWNKKREEINAKIKKRDEEIKRSQNVDLPLSEIKAINKRIVRTIEDDDELFIVEEGKSHFENAAELKKWIVYRSGLLETLEKKRTELEDPKWSDIEDVYYDCLIKCYGNYNDEHEAKKHNELSIIKLNQEFQVIRNQLHDYLTFIYESTDKENSDFVYLTKRMKNIFSTDEKNIGKVIFVCFNYTRLLLDVYGYKDVSEDINDMPEVVYIHGNIDDADSMIFGYGDELDSNSLSIQENKDNAFLEYNKAVLYARGGEYQKIVPYIYGEKDYEVYILGHSCANSDRALLNEIFDNNHCKLIKYFYYEGANGKEKEVNFKEQISNLYRIFGDNHRDFRKVFCPLNKSEHIPQIREKEISENRASQNLEEITVLDIQFVRINGGWLDANTKLEDYWIGKYPITQKQWENVMKFNFSHFKGDNHPVENISYSDCLRFIAEINSQIEGLRAFLPTEEQWIFAAQGGENSVSRGNGYEKIKYFDESPDVNSWYFNNSNGTTHRVGQKKPNKLGLYDMSGNVWEFVYGRASYGGSFRSRSEYIPENKIYRMRISANNKGKVGLFDCFDDVGLRLILQNS